MSVEALTAFFDLILPPAGHKCLFVLPDKRHYWFTDHRAMAAAALRLDQEGKTVYHGNASFKSRSRKARNVAAIKALYLDVDGGDGKAYDGPGECYGAFQKWQAATGLASPLVVGSGHGIHTYWPLRDPLDLKDWLNAASRLRDLAAAHGLVVDTTVTCDAARILRPPFTHNRKGLPTLVRLGPKVPAYDREQLAVLFSSPAPARVETLRFESALAHLPVLPRGDDDDGLTNIYADQPSDPDLIVRECAQVRRLRDARGSLAEPEWYAVLGVLAHCGAPGRERAHAWSAGDVRYDVRGTDDKLEHARTAAGPTSCRRFAGLDPAGCRACPHRDRITSPIQLGRLLPPTVTAPEPPKLELPVLPEPYHWRGMRLAATDQSGKDDVKPYHIITDYPFVVSELQEGERSGGISAVIRSWEPMRQAWREFTVGLKEVLGDRGAGALAHHGVAVDKRRWQHMSFFLAAMVNHYRGTRHYGTRYEQFGWKTVAGNPAFVIGVDLLALGVPPARCYGSQELERRAAFLSARGSLAAWQAAVEKTTLRRGMEPHTFQGLCGFASILYHLTGAEGGTIVHSTTLVSGKGKTFGLKIAGSVWGDWFALRIKERDTEVAKFIAIGVLGHLPVLYDELRAVGPDAADRIKGFVLQYTLGEDKARGAPEGGLKSDALPWSNIMLSTANISLIDTCVSDGSETAQASRVFEFTPPDLPADITTSYGDALEQEMAANAGHAGRAFAGAVMARWAWVCAAVPQAVRMWEQRLGGGPELRYTLRLLGAVSVAMAVLQQAGLLRLDVPALMAWMDATARENAARLAVEREADPAGILSRMMADLLPNTLVMPGPVPRGASPNLRYEAIREPRGELLARQEIVGREYLVLVDTVKRWMQEHKYPMTEIGRMLKASGIVRELRKKRTLAAGWRRLAGQDCCWQIDGNHPAIAELWVDVGQPEAVAVSNVVEFPGAKG